MSHPARQSISWSLLSLALLVQACSSSTSSPPNNGQTPATHVRFQIVSGAHAVVASSTAAGAVSCNTCHGAFTSFQQFDCLGCHTHAQPAADQLHANLTADQLAKNGGTYAWTSPACYACHADAQGIKQPFSHTGITAGCALCHAPDASFAALPVVGFTHVPISSDCSTCHAVSSTWRGVSMPLALSSDPARNVPIVALVPTWAGSSISSFASSSQSLVMAMDHLTAQVTSTAFSSCNNCHANGPAGLLKGDFHASLATLLLPAPSACAGCHAVSAPLGFVGPLASAPARSPPSGEMRHDAVAWSGATRTATPLVPQDCAVCHADPSQSTSKKWDAAPGGSSPARFHASLTSAAAPQPASCLDCHANSRPGAVGLPSGAAFDHLTGGAAGDCVACHASGPAATWSTSWVGGRFHLAGSATPATCLPCHAGERPATAAAWLSRTASSPPFDFGTNAKGATHGNGLDCALCHTGPGTGAWGGSQTWAGGRFAHGTSSIAGTSCLVCHSTQRPDLQPGTTAAAAAALLGFDHAVGGVGDCYNCHQATVARGTYASYGAPLTGALPGGDWAGGQALPSQLIGDPARTVLVAALIPTYSGATISSLSPLTESLPMPMDHQSIQVTAAVYSTCANCHTGAGTGSYLPGNLHDSLATLGMPQPTVCSDCHQGSAPIGFVGPLATQPARVPPSGEMKHDAVAWSGATSTATKLVTQDCAVCHADPSQSTSKKWDAAPGGSSPAQFHASLSRVAAPQPVSCLDCHANSRPGAVGLPSGAAFDHLTGGAAGECVACHANGPAATWSASWAGGKFHLPGSATPASCLPCHAGERPATAAAWLSRSATSVPFDFGTNAKGVTHGDGQDCALCHTGPGTGAWGGSQTWAAGLFAHGPSTIAGAACLACHSTQRPDLQPGTTAAAAAALLGFDHAVDGVGDCISCHQATVARGTYASYGAPLTGALPGGDWAGGQSFPGPLVNDPARTVQVVALIPTYSGTTISSLSPRTEALLMPMDHQSAQVPTAAFSTCANCHADAATGSFFPGNLHASLATLLLPQPAACSDCHQGSAPIGFVGPTATQPARLPPSGEMKHDAVAWSGGLPTATLLASEDCATCHVPPSLTLSATWSMRDALGTAPALYHPSLASAAKLQPTSCVDCHANSRPAGVLASPGAALPPLVQFQHPASLPDCVACHTLGGAAAAGTWTASWTGGQFHLAGAAAQTSCLPCHGGERPLSTTGWLSTTYQLRPFDYGPSALDTHGAGLDCAQCHAVPAAGSSAGALTWQGGEFLHGPATISVTTCIACHTTQRPDLLLGAAIASSTLGFDHALNGTGDCLGCHQATVTRGLYASLSSATGSLPGGDWRGGLAYPGGTLVGATSKAVSLVVTTLTRSGAQNLVTGAVTTNIVLYAQMLHTSLSTPAPWGVGAASPPDFGQCWHCHAATGTVVTSLSTGLFHPSLATAALPEPTACLDCHVQTVPAGIVEKAASALQAMDHAALFTAPVTLGGKSASGVAGVDCGLCHGSPGTVFSDGQFHARIGAAVPQDCVVCHYPLVADAASADLTNGVRYSMRHASAQLTIQACQTCHTTALAQSTQTPIASTLWSGGLLHASLPAQPASCLDCHAVSAPAAGASTQSSWTYTLPLGSTASNQAQWMNHGASGVAGQACSLCHAADAKAVGSAWSKASSFHATVPNPATCQECHGLTNGGGAIAGTNNNLPAGLTNSVTVTTASSDATTGVAAGTLDQISHLDVNVTARECKACHTQSGRSAVVGVQGKEWAQARFHSNFTAASPLVTNGTSGRCSNCHLNVKPTAAFSVSHAAFTATSTQDCSACHSYPGTGSSAAPNWLGAAGAPLSISVGGFAIPVPPATTAGGLQAAIANLPHPGVTATTTCASCHTGGVGARGAIGYDHVSTLANANCSACHEAGSDLLAPTWNGTAVQASGAGDTRPFTIAPLKPSICNTSIASPGPHFFPSDCSLCHKRPTGIALGKTGATYITAWKGSHPPKTGSKSAQPCSVCHSNGCD